MPRKNEIEVLVTADVEQYEARMRAATESAGKFSKALRDTDKSANTLTNNIRRVAGNLSVMRGPLDGITGRVNAFATLVGSAGGAAAVASVSISALATSLAMGTKASIENETAMARMNAVLHATGQVAGLTAHELEAMASRLSDSTLASGTDSKAAIAQLLTFRNVSKDVFEETLKAAQNLADSGFGSLQSNIETLGEVIDAPLQGMSALSEMGINFTAEQQRAIETAVRFGDTLTAQRVILDEVADRVLNVSETLKKTTAEGAFDDLAKQIKAFNKELAESVGALDLVKGGVGGLAKLIRTMREGLDEGSLEERIAEDVKQLEKLEKALAEARGGGRSAQMGVPGIEANIALTRKHLEELRAIQKKYLDDEATAREKEKTYEAAREAEAKRALDEQKVKALEAAKAVAKAQEVTTATAQGDPYAAEVARYSAAKDALEQKRIAATADPLMDREALNAEYNRAAESQLREHEARMAAIQKAEADKRTALRIGELQTRHKALQEAYDAEATMAALPGDYDAQRDALRIKRDAALDENKFELELLRTRGDLTVEQETALAAQRLLANEQYYAGLKELAAKQEADEIAAYERRLAAQRAAAAEADRIERERLAEQERKRALAIAAIQTEMQARADLANVAMERAEMSGDERSIIEAQRAAAQEQLEFEERLMRERATLTLTQEEALVEQKKIINERYNAALAEMDKRQWQMRRDWEEQRLEAIRESREEELGYAIDLASQTNELLIATGQEASAAQKAAAVTQATIMGILAVQSVLADYTMPLGLKFAMIPVVTAMAAANVAKIAAQRAMGGPVAAGSSYLVGERGPEVFTPYAGGMITPGNKAAPIVVNIVENTQRGGQTEQGNDGSLTMFVAAIKADIARDIQRGTGIGSMVVRR